MDSLPEVLSGSGTLPELLPGSGTLPKVLPSPGTVAEVPPSSDTLPEVPPGSDTQPEVLPGSGTVAAYLPFGTEPGATARPSLPDVLAATGLRVLLPVLLPDLDLDWAVYDGRLVPGARGTREPPGPRLGPGAVADTDLVVAPAVAVDLSGVRLGRGGGSYDRALARVGDRVPTVVPLFDGELRDRLPAEPHDARVDAVLLPSGPVRLPAA